jgi:ankyrin repeat protein
MNRRVLVGCGAVMLLWIAGISGAGVSSVADAVMKGDKATLRTLLQQKADVNQPQIDGATALHWAVFREDLESLDLLIRAGAKVDAANREGVTPLAMACLYGNVSMINHLLKAGASAKERGPNGQTALMLAARNGEPEAVRVLIAAGADVNARETLRGTTALMWAVEQKHPAAVKALLDGGADFRARSAGAGLPRNYMAGPVRTSAVEAAVRRRKAAAEAGRTYEEQLAFEGVNGRFGAPGGLDGQAAGPARGRGAPAGRAAAAGAQATPAGAASAGAAPAAAAPAGAAPADTGPAGAAQAGTAPAGVAQSGAAQQAGRGQGGQSDRARRPAEAAPAAAAGAPRGQAVAGAKPVQDDNPDDSEVVVAGLVGSGGGGLTALVFAARDGDLESANLLLEAGADVNQVTEYGWSPLLTATNNRHYKLAVSLIEWGADVNLTNKGKWTPLYLATDNRNIEGGDYPVPKPDMDHLEFINILLDHGADPNLRAKDNTLSRTIFTMQWFLESGATPFVRAAQSSDTELMKLLLAYGADPKIPTDHNDTALTSAAGMGWVEGVTYERSAKENFEAVKMLLDMGLDPNAANNDGRTSLMVAAMKGRSDVVQLLVDHGARLDTRDRGNRDTETTVSVNAGHTWEALDYADGLVRVGVQSAVNRPETAALVRKLMAERGLPVPPPNRVVESICIVEICKERTWK